jgi:Predicted membrane protein
MKSLSLLLKTNDAIAPVVLRLMLAITMFPHGAQKVLGWWGGYGFAATLKSFTENMNIPAPFALLAIAAEFLGPIALVLGLFTRVAAFGIAATITVAALMVSAKFGFFMNWSGKQAGEGIEYHLLMVAIALALMIQGGGRWALDSVIASRLDNKRKKNP